MVHASIDKGNEDIKDIKETVDKMNSYLINMQQQGKTFLEQSTSHNSNLIYVSLTFNFEMFKYIEHLGFCRR